MSLRGNHFSGREEEEEDRKEEGNTADEMSFGSITMQDK